MYLFRKPFLYPTLMTLFMVSLCIGLGIWQSKRLVYKQALIKQIDENFFIEPIDINYVKDYLASPELLFLHVKINGKFLDQYFVYIASKMHAGELGYHLLLPFQMQDNKIIWVNLGWIPRYLDSKKIFIPQGNVKITGHLYHPQPMLNFFTPKNPSRIGVDHPWYSYDLVALNGTTFLNAEPKAMLFLDQNNFLFQKEGFVYPIPGQMNINIPNNHLQYLITWFGFAIIFIIMYVIYIIRHKKG